MEQVFDIFTFRFVVFWYTIIFILKGLLTVTIEQPSYSVPPDSSVTLQCLVNSTVAIRSVYWERYLGSARSRIRFSTDPNKYSGSTTTIPSLTIISVSQLDIGYYRCFASNDYRTVHSSSTILSFFGSKYFVLL